MSRVGKRILIVPEKTDVKVDGRSVKVKGPQGELSCMLPEGLEVESNDKRLSLKTGASYHGTPAVYGTTNAAIKNMIEGVSKGFEKVLEIKGVGYRAQVQGAKLNLTIGFSHPVVFEAPKEVKLAVDAKANTVTVSGIDRQLVGETASRIRSLRPPEPYKATGIRYQGEHIVRKAGKTAATAGGKK